MMRRRTFLSMMGLAGMAAWCDPTHLLPTTTATSRAAGHAPAPGLQYAQCYAISEEAIYNAHNPLTLFNEIGEHLRYNFVRALTTALTEHNLALHRVRVLYSSPSPYPFVDPTHTHSTIGWKAQTHPVHNLTHSTTELGTFVTKDPFLATLSPSVHSIPRTDFYDPLEAEFGPMVRHNPRNALYDPLNIDYNVHLNQEWDEAWKDVIVHLAQRT